MDVLYQEAECRGGGHHDLFFSDRPHELSQAQALCEACPVQLPCLEGALERGEDWGVWGGVIFWDGEVYWRKRGRGRPRRHDADLPLEADRGDLWQLVKSA